MLYIATSNPHKRRELDALLAPLGVEVAALSLDVPEPFDTFAENAWAKAEAYAKAARGVPVLVEDSGLVVEALGGLPGVWSARYKHLDTVCRKIAAEDGGASYDRRGAILEPAEPEPRELVDWDNLVRVMGEMGDVPDDKRGAYYLVHMVLAAERHGVVVPLLRVEARHEGRIARAPRGTGGFGYDAIFVGNDTQGRTIAELSDDEKARVSHRARAVGLLRAFIAENADEFR